jgi:type II secretory pathway pseudopilin PulG
MTVALKFRRDPRGRKGEQDGYMLLTLLFVAAVVAIFLAAALPQFSQQMRRDREEELIHRGVQYSRAIRRFYKKFGRYPVRLEELENTNNLRFLRKRYKDPITNKDFKILHFGDVKMAFGPGIAGATPVSGLSGAPGVAVPATPTLTPRPGNGTGSGSSADSASPSTSSASSSSDSASSDSTGASGSSTGFLSSSNAGSQTFGGGPIVGVVSASTKQSIREFNKKDHYNDWQFIYDPSTDRGGLLNTPAQPALQPVGGQQNPAGVPSPGGAGAQGITPQTMQPPQQPPQQLQPQTPPDQ